MVFSMYKPIVEDDEMTICSLMRLYRTYYRIIGSIIAVVGIAVTPFIPKLIKGDIPAELNIYILYLLNLAATVLSYNEQAKIVTDHHTVRLPLRVNWGGGWRVTRFTVLYVVLPFQILPVSII